MKVVDPQWLCIALGVIWVSLGSHLGVTWVSLGCHFGVTWVSLGCHFGVTHMKGLTRWSYAT